MNCFVNVKVKIIGGHFILYFAGNRRDSSMYAGWNDFDEMSTN